MTPEELETLREGWDFEAKRAGGRDGQSKLPESFWETYSAMANTQGGLILLGAKERSDGSLEVVGLANPGKVESDLWNTIDNPQKVSANVLRRGDVEQREIRDKVVLLVRVPKAPRAQLPVYLKGSWERGTYLRVHEGDRRADREVARRMLADSIRDRDSGVVDDCSLDDLDPESVRRYREYFAARRADHPFLGNDNARFLEAIGAAQQVPGDEVRPTGPGCGCWAASWRSAGCCRTGT